MKRNRFAWLLAALVVSLGSEAGSQPLVGLPATFDRERAAVHLEVLSEGDLKALYLHCSRESSRRLLDTGEAAWCVTAGEVLKRRNFGGDFEALLAWWRTQRDD